jgi:hypothetical protein
MAQSIVAHACHPERARGAGQAGRTAVERRFSLAAMVQQYQGLYDRLLRVPNTVRRTGLSNIS